MHSVDSYILRAILSELAGAGYKAIPIHDCIGVPIEALWKLRAAASHAYSEVSFGGGGLKFKSNVKAGGNFILL